MNSSRANPPERLSDLPPLERGIVISYLALQVTFPLLWSAGLWIAAFGWRPGAYLLVVALFAHFFIAYVAMGVFARLAGDLRDHRRSERLSSSGSASASSSSSAPAQRRPAGTSPHFS